MQGFLIIVIGVLVLSLVAVLMFMLRKIKRINAELQRQKNEIEQQKNLIEQKNCEITDSINYARKIQDNILLPETKLKQWLPQMFIYFKPKDIVSGDFYWFSKFENKYVITAIDCTGHGVPGAFLSMVGNTLLHEIVNIKHVFKPDVILTMLHTGIRLALNQSNEDSDSEDGMDMSLCTVDAKLHRFQFAGAKNNLYVVQGDKLKILKANYYSIGGRQLRPDMQIEFTCYDFMYEEEVEQRIKILKQDYNAMQVSRFYKPRPVIRDAYIPVSHYIDNGFFADYKTAKNLLVMDKGSIIKTVLEKFPYHGNLERYNAAKSILELLNFNAIYDLCTLEKTEQLKVLYDSLKKKEKALLGEFIEPMDEIEEFDILDFISWLKQTVSIQTPELKAYLGEEDENYDNVSDNVVCMFDKNVCEGIRIVYQGRLYDYSIYKSRKKNEHIY